MNLVLTNLARNPEKYDETIKLIEKSFDYPEEHSFDIDFYPLMNPTNHENNHILIADGKVIAHIGVLLRKFGNIYHNTEVAFIGGIAVAEEYQGQGIFKEVFSKVLDAYSNYVAMTILWSNKDDLYEKFGFVEFGTVVQVGEGEFGEIEGFEKLEKLTTHELIQLKNLYNINHAMYLSVIRENREWDDILNVKSSDIYVRMENDKIRDYFIVNKGHDLDSVIHECSFYNKNGILGKFIDKRLWLPEDHGSLFEEPTTFYSGLMRVENPERFSEFVKNIFKDDLIINSFGAEIEFSFKGNECKLPYSEFIGTVFGPNPAEEFKEYGNWVYICGLDSI